MRKQMPSVLWNPWYMDWKEPGSKKCQFCGKIIYTGWAKTATWRKSKWSEAGKSAFSCWMCIYKKLEKKKSLFIEKLDGEITQIEQWEEVGNFVAASQKKRKTRTIH